MIVKLHEHDESTENHEKSRTNTTHNMNYVHSLHLIAKIYQNTLGFVMKISCIKFSPTLVLTTEHASTKSQMRLVDVHF